MTATVTGVAELDKAMASFGPKLTTKILKKAVRKAAKPVLESARAHVPIQYGTLHDSIKTRALRKSRRNPGRVGARVATTANDSGFGGEAYYGAFLEFGTRHIQALGYMRLAFDENRESVRQIFSTEIKRLIVETAREVK